MLEVVSVKVFDGSAKVFEILLNDAVGNDTRLEHRTDMTWSFQAWP